MPHKDRRKKQARIIRIARKLHRTSAIVLFVFFFIVAITSVLLGWKKHSGDYLMPGTREGVSENLQQWMPLYKLDSIAYRVLQDSLGTTSAPQIDRMDVRKDKGIVKFTFVDSYMEVQLDGTTGKPLSVGVRRSDFIENVHDGSILDQVFNTGNEIFKFLYSTIMGVGLFLFTLTGFWLWYGPKRMKKK